MIDLITSNKKTNFWGICAIVAAMLNQHPEYVSFLPPSISSYVLGTATIVCAVMTVLHMKDAKVQEEKPK